MNTARRGQRIERIANHLLQPEHATHLVARNAFHRGRWMSPGNDVFACIDIIAKPRNSGSDGRTRWIQVTGGRAIGRKKAKLAAIPWDARHDCVEIWRYVDGGGRRTHKATGQPRPRLYFQVYRMDEGFELRKENRLDARGAQ